MNNKRLKLSFWQLVDHYFIVIFLFVLGSFSIYQDYQFDGDQRLRSLLSFGLFWIVLAIIFCFIQWKALKFKEFKISNTESDFKEAVQRTANELSWTIKKCNSKSAIAFRPWNLMFSWGEMITITRNNEEILINSICDPNQPFSITSFGWNKKNVKTFLINLKDVSERIPVKAEEIELPEKEWSLKRILIRLFMYPFCLFIIICGIFLILEPLNYRSLLAGVGAIIIACVYLYADINLIINHKHNSK